MEAQGQGQAVTAGVRGAESLDPERYALKETGCGNCTTTMGQHHMCTAPADSSRPTCCPLQLPSQEEEWTHMNHPIMAAARKSENPRMMRLDSGYASSDDVPAAKGAPQRAITPLSTDDWECETVHDVSSTCSPREWVSSATSTSSASTLLPLPPPLPTPQPPRSKPNPLTNPATAAKFNIKYHIPSPFFYEFHDATAAMRYIYSKCSPSSLIIKDPVSKSSLHPSNIEAAISFLRASNLHDPKVPFDEKRLFIEEFMSGEEAFARVEVQDEGVGMLCSLEVGGVVRDEVMADVQEIAERVLEGLREEGIVTASVIRIRLVLALDGAIVTGYFVDC